ncbi:unnamed protein product [Mycena citricolor]|uniref:Arrestin-like N-terminal domain-containing protein n=1 Tax=Mycena citricolor TaxID=2018698 RepID=A0AAD2H3B9_9AGAR|nr:unnamed protein product [Mycena citricolor]
MAHSLIMHATEADMKPWLNLVLFSHALENSPLPMYHNAAEIAGEVRMVLEEPTALASIDIWLVARLDSIVDMQQFPFLSLTGTLWNKKMGDPTTGGVLKKGRLPAGSYVFPFSFPALPADTIVKHPDDERRKNKARVPLPPTFSLSVVGGFSGNLKYVVGVNVERDGFGSIDEEFEMPVQYLPLSRIAPRETTTFPFLPLREDWPFTREVVGGWTLTPFGGRGRIGEEVIELEGILGIQEPAVYTAGQMLDFSLLLWSNHPLGLEALAQPGAIQAGFFQTDIFASDALSPRNAARKNRRLQSLGSGRVWMADDGPDGPTRVCTVVKLPEAAPKSPASPKTAPGSRFQNVWSAEDRGEEEKEEQEEQEPTSERPGSPAGSFEGMDDEPDPERVVRLDGEIKVPACSHPSFRYQSMAREYILQILIAHPQYSHISPSGPGIVGEVPVSYTLNRFAHATKADVDVDYAQLPVKGRALVTDEHSVRLPVAVAQPTTKPRPTFQAARVAAF